MLVVHHEVVTGNLGAASSYLVAAEPEPDTAAPNSVQGCFDWWLALLCTKDGRPYSSRRRTCIKSVYGRPFPAWRCLKYRPHRKVSTSTLLDTQSTAVLRPLGLLMDGMLTM